VAAGDVEGCGIGQGQKPPKGILVSHSMNAVMDLIVTPSTETARTGQIVGGGSEAEGPPDAIASSKLGGVRLDHV
jgi:hypothetical protein